LDASIKAEALISISVLSDVPILHAFVLSRCCLTGNFVERSNQMKKIVYTLSIIILVIGTISPVVAYNAGPVREKKNMHQQTDTAKHLKVLFYLQDGVEVLDFAGPMEVFAAAGFDVATVSKTKNPIISQGILKIMPDYDITDAPHADIVAFFGGGAGSAAKDTAVIQWIKNKTSPQYYFSVCTGAFILGKTGLLDHLTITTWHGMIDALKQAIPTANVLSNTRFVDNGRIITTAGVSAGIDGALHLVAKLLGDDAAADVAKYMEYDKWVPGQGLVINQSSAAQ
jgi:transcriptional regulator GlxA family with amidase domain